MRRVAPYVIVVGAVVGACGDGAPPPRAVTTRAMPSLAATAAGPDDVVVARVNDRPVWGSCVAAQAEAGGKSAKAALGECIDLELAAQEAERRGLAADPEVAEAYDRALAAAIVEREITDKVKTVADLPPQLVEGVFQKNAFRMHRLEYRGSFFARIEYKGPEGTPEDLAAGAAARAAYATLEGRGDLFPPDVEAALRAAASPSMTISTASLEPATFGVGSRILPYYHEPLFALPAIGHVTPPVRGPFGWDLILYTSRIDPLDRTREQVLDELFPAMRVRMFMQWTTQLGHGHVQQIAHDDETLRNLLESDQ